MDSEYMPRKRRKKTSFRRGNSKARRRAKTMKRNAKGHFIGRKGGNKRLRSASARSRVIVRAKFAAAKRRRAPKRRRGVIGRAQRGVRYKTSRTPKRSIPRRKYGPDARIKVSDRIHAHEIPFYVSRYKRAVNAAKRRRAPKRPAMHSGRRKCNRCKASVNGGAVGMQKHHRKYHGVSLYVRT